VKKVLLALLLALVSTSARAAWTLAGGNDESTSYVDMTTINKKGDLVTMWYLVDFKSPKGESKKYLSTNGEDEYDCKKELYRTIAIFNMSEKMGKGAVVDSFVTKSIEWKPIQPQSIAHILWDVACTRHELIS
jgi:hypothetical protein